jgi:tRNA(Ile)-lysidine synthase
MAAVKRTDWKKRAVELCVKIPREALHPECLRWGDAHAGERWAVALSGGVDSVALLLLLWGHWPNHRKRLVAVHFNHRLRGRASDADQRFCRELCAHLGVSFRTARWSEASRDASEADARAARHVFFAQCLKVTKANALWLGHQQDDIAETMLMRIARGSGTSGLCAPRPVHRIGANGRLHLRPLLTLKKEELVQALRASRIPWREDFSNSSGRYFRNRIRNDVLAAWKNAASDRDALAGAALARERLAEDDAALDAWVMEIEPLTKRRDLNLRRLAGKPRAVFRRAIHLWLAAQGDSFSLSRQAFTALVEDLEKGRQTQHSLGSNAFAKTNGALLKLVRARRKKPS